MRSVFDVYLAKRDSPGDEAYATLSLPASPYEIMDALERVRPDGPEDVDLAVEEYHGFSHLAPYILPQPDLHGLNALAEKLSELNEYEATAFHGLVRMEADKEDGKLSVRRLLDLAYSTDCCHVVADVLNYSQLGRFYADNGFVPEAENLPDEAFDLLDFELIGRRMKSGEDGVFVERSADGPGGYVVRHEELKQAPLIPTGPRQKPDYVIRLNLWLISAISVPSDRKKAVEISLPTTEQQIMSALDSLGAAGLDDAMGAILDGPLPGLRSEVFVGSEVLLANELAERLQSMSDMELGVLKAVMEEVGFDTLDGVIELAGRTDEYIFEPGIRGVEQAAEAELNAMLGEKDAEVERCRTQLHQLIDDKLDAFILQVTCGDLSEYIRDEAVRAVPLMSASAKCKGMKPVAVVLPDGSMVETSTWKKAAAAILGDCAADPERHERLMEMRGRVNGNFRKLLGEDPDGIDAPLKITEGLYLESKFDTQLKRKIREKKIAMGHKPDDREEEQRMS